MAGQMARAAAENRKAELLETWLILEYCDQGSFDQAIRSGKFVGNLVRGCMAAALNSVRVHMRGPTLQLTLAVRSMHTNCVLAVCASAWI